MKKILAIYILMLPLSMTAQIYMSSNQQLVEQAVKNGIVIVRQSYQLEDTVSHQRYGRYGNEEFGKTYSLGIKVDGGIVLDKKAFRPWVYDQNFTRYQASHRPVNIKTEIRELNDSVFSVAKFNIDSVSSENPATFLPDSLTFAGNGFEPSSYSKPTEGWLVWITSSAEIQYCDSVPISPPMIYRKQIEFNADSTSYPVESPQTASKVWGGIFVVPEQTQIGQLTFKLAGTLIDDSNDGWKLFPLKEEPITEVSQNVGEELTPTQNSPDENNKNDKKKTKR